MKASSPERLAEPRTCAACGRSLVGRAAYLLGSQTHCLHCTLRYRPLLQRSAQTALVVGTILVIINQGTLLAEGALPAVLLREDPADLLRAVLRGDVGCPE